MTPEVAQSLADLGSTALLILVVGLAAFGLIVKKWIVPGWVWQAEVDRRVKLEAQLERVTLLLESAYRRARRPGPDDAPTA